MQKYDKYGHLTPYQLIPIKHDVFYADLVGAYPISTTRQTLYEGYCQYNLGLQDILKGVGFEQWVDGSFVTTKSNPRDVDIVTFLDAIVYDKYADSFIEFEGKKAKSKYGVDAYFVLVYPENHRYHSWYLGDRAEWLNSFGYSIPSLTKRVSGQRLPKGILQLQF